MSYILEHVAVRNNFNSARTPAEVAELREKWSVAQSELNATFPSVPNLLWQELEGLLIGGSDYNVSEEGDVMVHAYLLAQSFSIAAMNIINKHVGTVPIHARLGCVGEGIGVNISIEVTGIDNLDFEAIEQDFHNHLAHQKTLVSATNSIQ
ncbi:hypothetical protein L4D06_09730 [Enterovibrio makurazakiensis]|uniref:hypothetical protein n=1 Tax=Enterovibrio makurazakiensis TaxID=2910232 RepID=UPI003D1A3E68